MDTIASRYASALLELAIENDKVATYQKEMKYVYSVIKENIDLPPFLNCYTIENKDKKDLIEKIFKNDVSIEILHFIFLLIDKKRINYLSNICLEFNSECNKKRGVLEGTIYSIEPLNEDKIKQIENSVASKLQNKVELNNKLDSSLLGGIKVVINDTVFDNSIANRILALKQELLNGKDAR